MTIFGNPLNYAGCKVTDECKLKNSSTLHYFYKNIYAYLQHVALDLLSFLRVLDQRYAVRSSCKSPKNTIKFCTALFILIRLWWRKLRNDDIIVSLGWGLGDRWGQCECTLASSVLQCLLIGETRVSELTRSSQEVRATRQQSRTNTTDTRRARACDAIKRPATYPVAIVEEGNGQYRYWKIDQEDRIHVKDSCTYLDVAVAATKAELFIDRALKKPDFCLFVCFYIHIEKTTPN